MLGDFYNDRMRTSYRAGSKVSARELNKQADMLNGMRGEGGVTVMQDRSGFVIRAVGTGRQLGPWRYTIDQTTRALTFSRFGDVIEPTLPPFAVSGGSVSVTGGTESAPHYVVLEHRRGSGAALLPVASAVKPVSEPGVFRCALYDVGLIKGRVRVFAQRRFGDIDVPGYV